MATVAVIKTVTIAQAKQAQKKPEPTPEALEQEEKKALELLEERYKDEKDPDLIAAEAQKAKKEKRKTMTKKEKEKELHPTKKIVRKAIVKGRCKARPCFMCQKEFVAVDQRTKYCPDCLPRVFQENGRKGGEMNIYTQEEIEEKLRPWLRIGLNIREAAMEAGISHETVYEKMKTWQGFSDFIEQCRNFVVIKAKRAVFGALNDAKHKEHVPTAKWALEKLRPKEFGNKIEFEGTLIAAQMAPEKQEAMQALLQKRLCQSLPPLPPEAAL